jgi:predicted RNA methylase
MATNSRIEAERLSLQETLDLQKTQSERNKLGQFATPTGLAEDILKGAREAMSPGTGIRFLDPAIGTGSFYSALLSVFPEQCVEWARGFEIDSHYGEPAASLWGKHPLEITMADFTTQTPPENESEKANLIVCNPPYVRHHHLAAADKARLRRASFRASGVALNGLSGLYCHFVCLSHAWLAKGGVAFWLIPSEFMDVNYGEGLKQYLLEAVTLERVHRFDPSDVQFDDALVSSAVVCFRNAPSPPGHVVRFTYGGSMEKPRRCREVPLGALRPGRKWTGIPCGRVSQPEGEALSLGDLFTIRRGIATGANGFFVLREDRAAAVGLPKEILKPILPSPRYLDVDEIQSDGQGYPSIGRRLVLIDCGLPEQDVRREYPSLWAYLRNGAAEGIADRYLCRHRQPWYAQEHRPPAPLLCTYMGRQKGDRTVFRFILNHSQATAANVYLLLYPKPELARAISGSEARLRAVWQALRAIDTEQLNGVGRVYGGGLHKLEPKELSLAPAHPVLEAVPEAEPSRGTLFSQQ